MCPEKKLHACKPANFGSCVLRGPGRVGHKASVRRMEDPESKVVPVWVVFRISLMKRLDRQGEKKISHSAQGRRSAVQKSFLCSCLEVQLA